MNEWNGFALSNPGIFGGAVLDRMNGKEKRGEGDLWSESCASEEWIG
jgi:hypothetical protein